MTLLTRNLVTSLVTFPASGIVKFIKNLNSNKARGKDHDSIPILKICGNTINKPSELIFKQALITGIYPSDGKKFNIILVHKKSDKQNIKIDSPVLLLPICGKVFERFYSIIYLVFSEKIALLLKRHLGLNLHKPIIINYS